MENRNRLNLSAMETVEAFSSRLQTVSWVWGGFTADIYEGRILREHDDLDYLTLNLHNLTPQFQELFTGYGWQARLLENGDLKLRRDSIKIHLGHVEIAARARWTHNGEKGSLWFPLDWLRPTLISFCGIAVHVVEPEFQFVMMERPQILNPNWKDRDKDISARRYLRRFVEGKGIHPEHLFAQVHESEPVESQAAPAVYNHIP